MDPSLPASRRIRGRKCVDGVPKRPISPSVGKNRDSSRDFLARSVESTLFFRGSRVAYLGGTDGNRLSSRVRRPVDDIRPRNFEPHEERGFGSAVLLRYRRSRKVRAVEGLIVRTGAVFALSPRMALRASLVGAIFLGAMSTALAYRYFGQPALAREETPNVSAVVADSTAAPSELTVPESSDQSDDRFVNEVTDDLASMQEAKEKSAFEAKVGEMVAGYPIEDMVPYIVEKDKIVAAFLVGIAKKESAWGKRVPLLMSHDCFNYWGYRGKRRFMGTGGHTCFNSPKDAVDTVARRLEKLVYSEKLDTPAEMMVAWKCGYDCSAHNKADTKKWIQDVDLYFHELDE